MTITRYVEVAHQATKTLPCPNCGKKLRRARTFTQTLNPWNKRADGMPKDSREIRAELLAEAAEWESQAEACSACKAMT